MNPKFFETLNYASVNEDWRTEIEALNFAEADDSAVALVVTGSGDRPLDLLSAAAGRPRVVSIDANPAQNHLLRLKVAAMQELPFADYLQFLGLHSGQDDVKGAKRRRSDVFRALTHALPPETRTFWTERLNMIRAGVLYQGRWERFYRKLAILARVMRPMALPALFALDDLDAQRLFVEQTWDVWRWRTAFRVLCNPWFSRVFFRDPAYFKYVRPNVGDFLYDRMACCLQSHLARDDFMINLVLRGKLSDTDLPPYLTPEGVDRIRTRLDCLDIVTGNMAEHLDAAPPGMYTHLSCSDVPSFLDEVEFRQFLITIGRAAAPNARFCVRQFLTAHPWPADVHFLERDPTLEARLAQNDHAFAYSFFAGTVTVDDGPAGLSRG